MDQDLIGPAGRFPQEWGQQLERPFPHGFFQILWRDRRRFEQQRLIRPPRQHAFDHCLAVVDVLPVEKRVVEGKIRGDLFQIPPQIPGFLPEEVFHTGVPALRHGTAESPVPQGGQKLGHIGYAQQLLHVRTGEQGWFPGADIADRICIRCPHAAASLRE